VTVAGGNADVTVKVKVGSKSFTGKLTRSGAFSKTVAAPKGKTTIRVNASVPGAGPSSTSKSFKP
jgi:hypothetical protein